MDTEVDTLKSIFDKLLADGMRLVENSENTLEWGAFKNKLQDTQGL